MKVPSPRNLSGLKVCRTCIYDETISKIEFDEQGVCNYCKMIESLKIEYKTGTPEGIAQFESMVKEIKAAGQGKKYDCMVGVSGGTDSSYMLHLAIELGLRPLAVHYDNTWNTAIATENIRKITKALNIDLFTHVVDNREIDDITLSCLKASIPELDGPTDIALAQVLYQAAAKFGVRYVLEGHSFIAEGVSPLGNTYVDGRYFASIQRTFGTVKMKTYPNMPFLDFLKWTLFYQIKKIRPYWYINYTKEAAQKLLMEKYGWVNYGGHHLENRLTAFNHSYYYPVKFGLDLRNNYLSALVRSGAISRDEGLRRYSEPPYMEDDLLQYFMKRMGLSEGELESLIAQPPKSFRDYKTYKKWFEFCAPMFKILADKQLVPKSFYIKYCSPSEVGR